MAEFSVENVLLEAAENEALFKTVEVHKDIDLDIDLGNLLTSDTSPIYSKDLKYVFLFNNLSESN